MGAAAAAREADDRDGGQDEPQAPAADGRDDDLDVLVELAAPEGPFEIVQPPSVREHDPDLARPAELVGLRRPEAASGVWSADDAEVDRLERHAGAVEE